jgi:hypothetical protein
MRITALVLIVSLGLASGCVPLSAAAVPPFAGAIIGGLSGGRGDGAAGRTWSRKGFVVGALIGLAIDAVVVGAAYESWAHKNFSLADRGCESEPMYCSFQVSGVRSR